MSWQPRLIGFVTGGSHCPGDKALASPILILGAPRSGTTWLAKIVDSHPDVLYRHEPDETLPPPVPVTEADIPGLVERWANDRSARTVSKRPFFAKSWQPAWARGLRTLLAASTSAAGRLPLPRRVFVNARIPDLAASPPPRVAIKSIDWAEGAAVLARALPASRTILILRHPCGQVASVMRGNREHRFALKTAGTDMPFDEAGALRHAATQGTGEAAFQALSEAAKYAWSWRAFNEPTYAELAAQRNVHVVLHEALCAQPELLARRILAFAGLDWNLQTAQFVARSTSYQAKAGHQGSPGYYAIFRDAVAAAEAWRTSMPLVDQEAVRFVVAGSPLARLWPDLLAPPDRRPGEL